MTEYRELRDDEMGPAVALWTEVFPVGEEFFTSLLDGGEAGDNVSLAALEDGRIVSSVHVFMRRMRGRDGNVLKVGGIGSVSTHPHHRKNGHSGRLLEMAIGAMEREGCVWSLLGTGVNDHYARYGWRTVSTPAYRGELREDLHSEGAFLTEEDSLDEMARLYDAETASRPLATVRSPKAWQTAVLYRLGPNCLTAGAHDGDRLAAYVVARAPWGEWSFVEAAGDPSRLPGLFAKIGTNLRNLGDVRVEAALPEGPAMEAFASVVERVVPGESRGMMLRPIADRISWPDLLALYGDPRGRHGDLDAF